MVVLVIAIVYANHTFCIYLTAPINIEIETSPSPAAIVSDRLGTCALQEDWCLDSEALLTRFTAVAASTNWTLLLDFLALRSLWGLGEDDGESSENLEDN
jgi:hypothetical protein